MSLDIHFVEAPGRRTPKSLREEIEARSGGRPLLGLCPHPSRPSTLIVVFQRNERKRVTTT